MRTAYATGTEGSTAVWCKGIAHLHIQSCFGENSNLCLSVDIVVHVMTFSPFIQILSAFLVYLTIVVSSLQAVFI